MKKKKSSMLSPIINMLMGAICGAFCIYIIECLGKRGIEAIVVFLLLLILIVLFLYLHIVIHEGGHLILGLFSGYQFLSFRIGSFMWVKKDQKIHFHRLRVAGTGGQCLLVPPEIIDGKIPYFLYNMGGCFMNFIVSTFCCILAFLCISLPLPSTLLFICGVIGYSTALTNGIPMHVGLIDNDGYNTWSIYRCPEALHAFWLQMKISAASANNQRLKDMKDAWFEKPSKELLRNNLIATIAVFRCNRLLDMSAYEEAKVEIEELLHQESGILGLHYHMLTNDLIYLELISDCDKERIKQLSTKAYTKFCKQMRTSPSILRTQYASALLFDHDEQKAGKLKETFDNVKQSYPYQSDIASEVEMMAYVDTLYQK